MVKGGDYLSFLLRLWQGGAAQRAAWRASLEEIATGERRAFADLDALLAYLREQTGADLPPGAEDERRESDPDRDTDMEREA